MGEYDPTTGLTHLGRNVSLEPLGQREREAAHGAATAYEATIKAWQNNEPAMASTHRANYTRLFPDEQEFGMGQLAQYLHKVQTQHPEAVYLTSYEVAQLYRTGTAAIHLGKEMICRNYTDEMQTIKVEIPSGHAPETLKDLHTDVEIAWQQSGEHHVSFTAPEGDFSLKLKPARP